MSYDIRNVQNINHLIMYFSKVLNWDIDTDSFDDIDDISYDFSASDLGLKEEAFAKIKTIKQLPPMVDGQKWGIFCIEFDSKRFEVTALRKVLSGLVPSRRNSADHAVWNKEDLLFLCFWGEENNRTIGVAHFEDKQDCLPQIKMTYCAPAIEDTIHIQDFVLKIGNLAWPVEVYNYQKWHDDWSKAFTTSYKQVIRDSQTLTMQLAKEAIDIRDRILETLEIETEAGYVHQLYNKFKETLIHDMSEKDFADMYAQTVVYGLFSARCMDDTQENFSANEAVDCIPNTNPFLKSLMKECLGSRENSKLSFDELEIGDVVDLLMHTNTDEIIRDFNRVTGGGKEDPVIHFYEEFLTAYDKTQKVKRGVYYTPQPVVNFMVRAVDSIIKKDFGLDDGLASTETIKIKYKRQSKYLVGGYTYKEVEDTKEIPSIQILDPATGTGTFIRQIILQVYDNFKSKNSGMNNNELDEAWNKYVSKHLLPRLNAFELMMAPYAVAHMKLAMVLKDTGYNFNDNERLHVYLTNSLEEPGGSDKQISIFDDPLASESVAANAVKKNKGINVVIGNPPYAVSSSNKGDWIERLVNIYKTEPGGKEKLKEQKHSIDSDEIKFIRYAQYLVNKAQSGIVAYINPHGYLDKPTFRGMRWQLLDEFDCIYILNLHGNSNHQEKNPDGGKDENVFDIQQGVCINILVKKGEKKANKELAEVYYADVYGSRDYKYNLLSSKALDEIAFTKLTPNEPHYLVVPVSQNTDYYNGFCLEKLFNKHLEGIQTGKDKLVLHKSKESLIDTINSIRRLSTEEIRSQFQLGKDGRDWKVEWAKEDLDNNFPDNGSIIEIALRPFDKRWSFYTGNSSGFIKCCRDKVSKEMIGHNNLAFALTRNAMPQKPYSNFVIVNTCIVGRFIGDFSTSTQLFPVWSYDYELGKEVKIPNMDMDIVSKISTIISRKFTPLENNDKSFDVND